MLAPHTPPQVLLAGAPMAGAGCDGATVEVVVDEDVLEVGDEFDAVAGPGAGVASVLLVVVFVADAGVSPCVEGEWAASDGPASARAPNTAPAATTGRLRAAPMRTPRLPTASILRPHPLPTRGQRRLTRSVTAIDTTPYTAAPNDTVSCRL